MNEHDGRFADRTAKTARESVEKGNAAAEGVARRAEQSYFAAADGIRDFNVRLIEKLSGLVGQGFKVLPKMRRPKCPSR